MSYFKYFRSFFSILTLSGEKSPLLFLDFSSRLSLILGDLPPLLLFVLVAIDPPLLSRDLILVGPVDALDNLNVLLFGLLRPQTLLEYQLLAREYSLDDLSVLRVLEGVLVDMDVDALVLLVLGLVHVVDAALLQVAEVHDSHPLRLALEEGVEELDVDHVAVGVQPNVLHHSGRVVVQHLRASEREENHHALAESMPESKEWIDHFEHEED